MFVLYDLYNLQNHSVLKNSTLTDTMGKWGWKICFGFQMFLCYLSSLISNPNPPKSLFGPSNSIKIRQVIHLFFFFCFCFNWDLLHAVLNSHYKVWSSKKRSSKNLKHKGNLLRNLLFIRTNLKAQICLNK